MPILKSRYDYVKIYRPNGCRYAHGQTLSDPGEAVDSALRAFQREFGSLPRYHEEMHIEMMCVTGGWSAAAIEIKEQL